MATTEIRYTEHIGIGIVYKSPMLSLFSMLNAIITDITVVTSKQTPLLPHIHNIMVLLIQHLDPYVA